MSQQQQHQQAQGPSQADKQALVRMIDHTLLRADATAADIQQLCDEASQWGFGAVCVNSCFVALAARLLAGSGVAVCSVVGFPLGAMGSRAKAAEARLAVEDGASELDMVIALGAAKAEDWQAVEADIAAVVEAAGAAALVKVIIECCLLTDPEKIAACQAAVRAGAAFVKTSTGFSTGGASAEDVSLMRRAVGEGIGVKASGGIKTVGDLQRMHQAGANRFGTSSGVAIAQAAL